jgi:HK97 family phage portal protein
VRFFRRKKEERATLEEILIQSGALTGNISKDQALNIPALTACVELISMTVASLPIKLYSATGDTTTTKNDPRVDLLNDDTKDTLDGFQFKKALVEDYLLHGGGYAFINRRLNNAQSVHYVDFPYIAINKNVDPIYKKAEFIVNGESFAEYQFIKLLRKTKDGVTGKGILKENSKMLSVAYNQMIYEEVLVKTGGNKRGFLKSQGRLSKEAMQELKKGWKDLYGNDSEDNVLILNNGLEFQEASQTSVELQLNEHKQSNADQICNIMLVAPQILTGEAGDEEYNNWIKICILPILSAFETALNKDFLLPSEKENHYFAFDTTELTKGSIEERFSAYDVAIKGGFMQIDEVRYKENLPPLKLNWIKMGLQDVLYFPKSDEIYTPNTNKLAKMGENPTVDPMGGANNGGFNQTVPNNPRPDEGNGNGNDSSKEK